jgi:hypothetical protein
VVRRTVAVSTEGADEPVRRQFAALLFLLTLPACATAPRSPEQARLDACLTQADRRVIASAQLEPGNRFSYVYKDSGTAGPEIEKLRACMQGRAPAYPSVR